MPFLRGLFLLLLLCSAASFAAFALTGRPLYKRYGLRILGGTLLAAVLFFVVLALERLAS